MLRCTCSPKWKPRLPAMKKVRRYADDEAGMQLKCAVLLVLMTPVVIAQNGAVEGIVTNSATHAGIPGVVVTLTASAGARDSRASTYRTTSDASGAFRIADVQEGRYSASFQKTGFVGLAPDQPANRPFLVGSRGDPLRLSAELVPGASLRGRVVDSGGHPAPNVRVEISRFRRGGMLAAITDSVGSFVFDVLEPGSYVLAARPFLAGSALAGDRPEKVSPLPAPPAEGGSQIWAPTYFPGFADRTRAERIIARAGAELSGYEIRLCSVPFYRIRGIVLNEDGSPAAKVPVKLTPADQWEPQEAQAFTSDGGAFEFPAVRPGEWRLIADASRDGLELRGFDAALVTNHDAENLEIRLSSPFTLNGFVDRQEPRDQEGNRKLTAVYLVPEDGPLDQQVAGFHKQDGTLQIEHVVPGRYVITPVGFIPGYYVASVLLGDREVIGQEVNLTNGSTPFRVIYKPNAGRVLGTVEKGEGSTVVLLPKEEAFLDGQFIRSAKCEAGGSFEVSSLRPGDYYAFAFDHVDLGTLEDPAFVRNLAPRAVTVQVKEGEIASMELQLTHWPE